jgi:hypothetical protein
MYFTVRTSPAGLADQLRQFERLHALGTALGCRYLHTPLIDSCHNYRGEILDDFLGLGLGELSWAQSARRDDPIVDVDFAAMLPGPPDAHDIDAAGRALAAVYGKSPDAVYRFRYEDFKRLKGAARLSLQFPFSDKYWRRRSQWPVASPFRDAPVRIAVHIRCGDMAQVVYKGQRLCNGHLIDEHDPAPPYVPVSVYRSLIQRLRDRFSAEAASLFVFSDGYHSTCGRFSQLAVSASDRQELLSLREHYEQELLALGSLPGVRLLVGEDEECLYSAIHACATCDILIKGSGAFSMDCFRRYNRRPQARIFTLPEQQTQILAQCGNLLGTGGDTAPAAFNAGDHPPPAPGR